MLVPNGLGAACVQVLLLQQTTLCRSTLLLRVAHRRIVHHRSDTHVQSPGRTMTRFRLRTSSQRAYRVSFDICTTCLWCADGQLLPLRAHTDYQPRSCFEHVHRRARPCSPPCQHPPQRKSRSPTLSEAQHLRSSLRGTNSSTRDWAMPEDSRTPPGTIAHRCDVSQDRIRALR